MRARATSRGKIFPGVAVTEEGCIETRTSNSIISIALAVFQYNTCLAAHTQAPRSQKIVFLGNCAHAEVTIGTWEISERAKKMTPQWPPINTRSGSAGHSRLAWVPLCFMAHLSWSTEEGMPTASDGRRHVVWCVKTTRPMRDGRLAYFACAR